MIRVLVLTSSICALIYSEESTFRAAVYEHAVIMPPQRKLWVKRSKALETIMKNMDVYKQQAIEAGRQKVNIIVFPEDGLFGMAFSRKGLESYLEYIPDPEENWNPCKSPEKYNNTEIQQDLSCMAIKSSLFVVANMGDYQPCDSKKDRNCPKDGHYQFNTNVVYNSSGFLVAKYHKINLFFEKQFDYPPVPKAVTFDTDFGRFAVFTCFDILFKNPAIDSLKPGVGNVVFPTAWMDALPLLAAVQYHSAFAAGAKVNLLAANINLPLFRFHGSGIYSPTGFSAFRYNETRGGKLLIADLPVVKSNNLNKKKPVVSSDDSLIAGTKSEHFQSYLFHDLFEFVPVIEDAGSLKVCQKDLCCYLDYERIMSNNSEFYAFGAFDGLHTYEGTYYLQICTLLKCHSTKRESCGSPSKDAMTVFTKVKVQGTFGTPYISPEILLTNKSTLQLSPGLEWTYDNGVLNAEKGFKLPLLSAGMFARDYSRDLVNFSGRLSPAIPNVITAISIVYLSFLYFHG